MALTISLTGDIRSTIDGYSHLARLDSELSGLVFEDIEIDFSGVGWLDANMCAALGAVLHRSTFNFNSFSLTKLSPSLQTILSKNGFLSHYGRVRLPDTYGTTMDYERFEARDARYFATYVEEKFVGRGIPQMTPALRKEMQRNIFEIFENAVMHAESSLGIFACGQFFPTKNKLRFSVADLGIGMRENLRRKLNFDLTAADAIEWAMSDRNTTKTGSVPGGLGLKLLQEFITLNKGRIQIASNRGYWEFWSGSSRRATMSHPFPGTVVNIEINAADKHSYCLASEISLDDIF